MSRIKAFLLGVWEFRTSCTRHFAAFDDLLAYDHGREFAHWITFRRFEEW